MWTNQRIIPWNKFVDLYVSSVNHYFEMCCRFITSAARLLRDQREVVVTGVKLLQHQLVGLGNATFYSAVIFLWCTRGIRTSSVFDVTVMKTAYRCQAFKNLVTFEYQKLYLRRSSSAEQELHSIENGKKIVSEAPCLLRLRLLEQNIKVWIIQR